MKKNVLKFLITKIEKYNPNISKRKINHIAYGLEGIYLLISKSIIIFSLAYFLNILTELLILLFFYNLIKLFSFGIHATKSSSCLFFSIIVFLGSSILINYLIINTSLIAILNIIFVLLIFKYAPADTYKKPIKKRRNLYKFSSTIITIILAFITTFIKNPIIINSIIIGITIQVIMILPITYKLFNLPYNNYKKEG